MRVIQVVLIACLLVLAGVVYAPPFTVAATTAAQSPQGYPCKDVCREKYGNDEKAMNSCIAGCATGAAGTESTSSSCEENCKRNYANDEYQASLCIQIDCRGQEASCKNLCYRKYGREEYERCYLENCQNQEQPPATCEEKCGKEYANYPERAKQCMAGCNPQQPPQTCEARCKLKASTSVTATTANVAAGFNQEVFARCMRDECGQGQGNDCETRCKEAYKDEYQARLCIQRKCDNQDISCKDGCYLEFGPNEYQDCARKRCENQPKPIEPRPPVYSCEEQCKLRMANSNSPQSYEACVKQCGGGGYEQPRGECDEGALKVLVCRGRSWQTMFEQLSHCPGNMMPRPMPMDGQLGKPEDTYRGCREGQFKCYLEKKTVAYCRDGQIVRSQDPNDFAKCGKRNFVQSIVSVFTGEKECKEGEFRCYDESLKAEVCENGNWRGGGEDLYLKYCSAA